MPAWADPTGWGIRTKDVALAVASVAVTGVALGGVSSVAAAAEGAGRRGVHRLRRAPTVRGSW